MTVATMNDSESDSQSDDDDLASSSSSSTDEGSSVSRADEGDDDDDDVCSTSSDEQSEESSPIAQHMNTHGRHVFNYTVDVLSDGSEHSGPPTLFLSVYKKPRHLVGPVPTVESSAQDDTNDDLNDTYLQARYAISGLGDLISRAAADQRYKLHPVRAVFSTDSYCSKLNLQGLPSVLTILHQAGKPELTVVSASKRVETVVESFQGKYKHHPLVRICQVPQATSSCPAHPQSAKPHGVPPIWWKVYEDEFLMVHASSTAVNVVYLHTMKRSMDGRKSLLLLPAPSFWTEVDRWTAHLPVITLFNSQEQTLQVMTGIVLQHQNGNSALQIDKCGSCNLLEQQGLRSQKLNDNNMSWYFVSPCNHSLGLLVRAQQQSCAWNSVLPTHFPWRDNDSSSSSSSSSAAAAAQQQQPYRLVTGNTLRIDNTAKLVMLDRLVDLQRLSLSDDRKHWPMTLQDFLMPSRHQTRDSNEIDLDEDEEIDGNKICNADLANNQAQLLVLGTGCASPSPHRSASAYALLFPKDDTAIAIEAGEGFVTQWHRHASGRSLCTIRFIWISHAHWDHYGGLINLLVCHKREREKHQSTVHSPKRLKITPPTVVAPRKVLGYLHSMLEPTSIQDYTDQCYDHNTMPHNFFPNNTVSNIVFWNNVRVDHSCHHAYGCILGYRQQQDQQLRVLCFSGDTRPCGRLVQACRSVLHHYRLPKIHFLWHDATFDETEQAMSLRKKHSTVQEAIAMSHQIQAERTLLTHFSQRYDTRMPQTQDDITCIGYALDGMLIPLY